jgi:hypothetical protein
MRQGQQNNNKQRIRGRNRKGPNPLTRSYESNGGDVKIRGTALHVAEKYVQLARDAQSSGDRVAGENYLQHAEHYYRIVAAAQAQNPQPQPVYRNDEDGEDDDGQDRQDGRNAFGGGHQPVQGNQNPGGGQPTYEPQPHVNGANNGGGPDQPQQGYGQSGEYRNEPRGEGYDNRGGGNFRHRRRRPYRDNYNDRGSEQAGGGAPEQVGGGAPEQGGGGGNPEPVETAPEVRGDE